jgi:hypothetical protein
MLPSDVQITTPFYALASPQCLSSKTYRTSQLPASPTATNRMGRWLGDVYFEGSGSCCATHITILCRDIITASPVPETHSTVHAVETSGKTQTGLFSTRGVVANHG